MLASGALEEPERVASEIGQVPHDRAAGRAGREGAIVAAHEAVQYILAGSRFNAPETIPRGKDGMAQQEIEIILARQLASYLAVPIFLIGPDGTLLFYNEPAEGILGKRFDETGKMPVEEWSRMFEPTDEAGDPLDAGELPIVVALEEGRLAHRPMWIQGLDGQRRSIEVASFPLQGQGNRSLGAVAVFWERGEEEDAP